METGREDTQTRERVGDLVEHLRRLSWEVRISHDQLLTAAEGAPEPIHGRAQGTAEKLMGLHRRVQEMSTKLPADHEIVVAVEDSEDIAGLCNEGKLALRELDILIYELREIFSETPVLETN